MTRSSFTYAGEKVPPLLPTPLYEGWRDGQIIALRHERRLYSKGRSPVWKHLLWRAGNVAAKLLIGPNR